MAHVEVQLLSRHLEQACGAALAEFDKPQEDRRGVVTLDRDPRVDQVRVGWPAHDPARLRGHHTFRERRASNTEPDDERATAFQEITPRKRDAREDVTHFVTSVIAWEARWIAFKIRG